MPTGIVARIAVATARRSGPSLRTSPGASETHHEIAPAPATSAMCSGRSCHVWGVNVRAVTRKIGITAGGMPTFEASWATLMIAASRQATRMRHSMFSVAAAVVIEIAHPSVSMMMKPPSVIARRR